MLIPVRRAWFAACVVMIVLVGACSGATDSADDPGGVTPPTETTEEGGANGSTAAPGDGEDSETSTDPDPFLGAIRVCVASADTSQITLRWEGDHDGEVQIIRNGEPIDSVIAGAVGVYSDLSAVGGQTYRYQIVPVGGTTDAESATVVTECGSAALGPQDGSVVCGVEVSGSGLAQITWSSTGIAHRVTVTRDGAAIADRAESPFIDVGSPDGQEVRYGLILTPIGSDGVGAEVDCGAVRPQLQGPADLAAAAEESRLRYLSPYQYVTLIPQCPDCSGAPVELYLTPDPSDPHGHIVSQMWVDGVATSTGNDLWARSPLAMPAQLLDAIAADADVRYVIDPNRSLVSSWGIDGVGAAYECFEVDTRPLDLREHRCERNLLD